MIPELSVYSFQEILTKHQFCVGHCARVQGSCGIRVYSAVGGQNITGYSSVKLTFQIEKYAMRRHCDIYGGGPDLDLEGREGFSQGLFKLRPEE